MKTLLLSLGLAGALSACSSGQSCVEKGGTCSAYAVCGADAGPPNEAEFLADKGGYYCPGSTDGGNSILCCLPYPR